MRRYNPKEIEPKWQNKWLQDGTYESKLGSDKPKYIGFGMFNYPSGAGIHVGHVRNYTIPDVITRFQRQRGFESYQPVGWDSFGLPAENFAIKTGISPQESTKQAIEKYHTQYQAMGWAVDWSKEINTTDPEYYKWTQWIFTALFEKGLAYQKESPQWWCDQCKTVLADEQVLAGKCWRHENEEDPLVTKKSLRQWFFKITEYADEILEATEGLDWTPSVKASQKSWIGRSEGAEIIFDIQDSTETISVFTTRPDTLFGATFMVLAPEHPLVTQLISDDKKAEVQAYVQSAQAKSEIERQETNREKSGVFTGAYAINPVNNEQIPIWIADYVLMGYGTGAIMAVPAHDERDFAFANQFNIPIVEVVEPKDATTDADSVFTGRGVLINSGTYDGLSSDEGQKSIVEYLQKSGKAKATVQYKMRDWLISRQRYWGAPIPIIHCSECGPVIVPKDDLPVLLPEIEKYQPTGGHASVLAEVDNWVNTSCPKCSQPAKRETDTMDGYVCSSWYFLRYISPHEDSEAWSTELSKKWMPIDFYNGGDHATAHLLYARFFMRFFHSLGLVDTPEPFKKMIFNGKVRASDGSMFSKSKGNGVDPLEVIESGYGADALRLYEMFAAPVEMDVLWDTQGIPGMFRFLNRVWMLVQEYDEAGQANEGIAEDTDNISQITHKMIKKVTQDIQDIKFNTAIAAMMEALNGLYKAKEAAPILRTSDWAFAVESLLQVLAPFAPHITEELWHQLGHTGTIHHQQWPEYDEEKLVLSTFVVVVQVNGKLRGQITVDADADKDTILRAAKNDSKIQDHISGKGIKKEIYVPGKLVNFVV